jgi:hypothetical protein
VPSITTARLPLREDIGRRTHRYLLSMGIRTACVVAAAVSDGPLRWAFLVGAVFLPYVAVVLANAGRERVRDPEPFVDATAIAAAPALPSAPPDAADGEDRRREAEEVDERGRG